LLSPTYLSISTESALKMLLTVSPKLESLDSHQSAIRSRHMFYNFSLFSVIAKAVFWGSLRVAADLISHITFLLTLSKMFAYSSSLPTPPSRRLSRRLS